MKLNARTNVLSTLRCFGAGLRAAAGVRSLQIASNTDIDTDVSLRRSLAVHQLSVIECRLFSSPLSVCLGSVGECRCSYTCRRPCASRCVWSDTPAATAAAAGLMKCAMTLLIRFHFLRDVSILRHCLKYSSEISPVVQTRCKCAIPGC